MTKFVLLSEFFPPDNGGIQASLGPMVERLGDQVTVIAPQVTPGERWIRRSLFSGSSRPRWWWLIDWLRTAHQQGMTLAIFGHYSAAVLAAVLARVPFAIIVSGNDLFFEQRRWPSRWFVGVAVRRARWVSVDSAFVAEAVLRYGVHQSQLWYSHPFISAERIRPTVRAVIPPRRIITIARLVRRKNVRSVVEAVAQLRKQCPDLRLDILGDGPERGNIETRIRELGLSSFVTVHGRVDEEQKWRLLHQADMFVMAPTIEQQGTDIEGFGLVYLEAAAVGLPVIASDSGGIRDAVVDGETGTLLHEPTAKDIANTLRAYCTTPELVQRHGEAGRQRVQHEFTDRVRLQRLENMLGTVGAEQPRVSVIIPAYQSAQTIAVTLQSLEAQTYQPAEIIVVNDGSTDALENAIAPWRERVIYLAQQNGGAPKARNAGFDRSIGEFVLFVDADVRLESTAIEQMVRVLQTQPDAAWVYSDFQFGWKTFQLHEYDEAELRRLNYIHTCSLLRREAFPRFDERLTKFQDWDLWLTMAEHGYQGRWIPRTLFHVEQRNAKIGMSTWLPSFMYRLPWVGQGKGNATIAKYRQAESVIRAKHHLD